MTALGVKNLVRDARKVQQTILMVGDITEIYVTSYERMLNDPYFTLRNWCQPSAHEAAGGECQSADRPEDGGQ